MQKAVDPAVPASRARRAALPPLAVVLGVERVRLDTLRRRGQLAASRAVPDYFHMSQVRLGAFLFLDVLFRPVRPLIICAPVFSPAALL